MLRGAVALSLWAAAALGEPCADPDGTSAHAKAAMEALLRGDVAVAQPDVDYSGFVTDALTCVSRAKALPPSGVRLQGARLGPLALDDATLLAPLSCRGCAIARLSARGAHWRGGVDLGGSSAAGGLDLRGARIDGDVALDGLQAASDMATAVDLRGARIAGDVGASGALIALLDASGARIGGRLALARGPGAEGDDGAPFRGYRLSLEGASIGGGLDMRGALVAGVSGPQAAPETAVLLRDATIGGGADLAGFRSAGDLVGTRLSVGGPLVLDGLSARRLRLEAMDVRGPLFMSDVQAREVDLDKARIDGDLRLRRHGGQPPAIGPPLGDGPALSLNNVSISGRVEIEDARIDGALMLDAARIGEDLWLRYGASVAGSIVAVYARFGQNVDLTGSALGSVDLTGARIGGELRLGAPEPGRPPPRWREAARLVLRNASVAAWVDADVPFQTGEPVCAETRAASWPGAIDLYGFAYQRIGGLGGGDQSLRETCGFYQAWLGRQEPFSLDPYRRLGAYLDAGGRAPAARWARWNGRERQLAEATGLEFVRLWLQRVFVGYGIYSYAIFLWVGAFVIVGAAVFSRSPEARASPTPLGVVFSLDMLLPFLSFRRAHGDVDFQSGVRWYLYLHKFMGWVFTLFFASALGGLFAI
jgi:hypothetical protein